MTLAEKVAQLQHEQRAGDPAARRAGVHLLERGPARHQPARRRHQPGLGQRRRPHATSFPTNFASTMSWDPALIYQETTAISDEIRGELDKSLWGTGQNNIGPDRNDYGSLTYWAPTVNLDRDPRWGRTDEAFGEDPYLVSADGRRVRRRLPGPDADGAQTAPYLKVAATAKHFALNNVEATGTGSSDTSDAEHPRLLHRAVPQPDREGARRRPDDVLQRDQRHPVAGRHLHHQRAAAADLRLRRLHHLRLRRGRQHLPADATTTGRRRAGPRPTTTAPRSGRTPPPARRFRARPAHRRTHCAPAPQLNCTGAEDTLRTTRTSSTPARISKGVIDNALIKLFTIRMADRRVRPARATWRGRRSRKAQIESPAHQALAAQGRRQLARAAEEQQRGRHDRAAAAGHADEAPQRRHRRRPGQQGDARRLLGLTRRTQTNAVQGITRQLPAGRRRRSSTRAARRRPPPPPASCSQQTLDDIKSADLVVVFAGTDGATAGEEHDRANLAMPGNYDSLIDQVHAVGNPRTVAGPAVRRPGGPRPAVADDFPAIVFSGYNGQAQGAALADVLFGRQNPDGHLDFTWYKDDSQLPGHPELRADARRDRRARPHVPVLHRHADLPVRIRHELQLVRVLEHPARHGPRRTPTAPRTVSFDVTNTGRRAGTTVAQLYAAVPAGSGVSCRTRS